MRCTSSVRRKSSEPAYNRERTGQLELEHQRETKSSPSSGADADESDYNSTTGGKRRRGRGLYRRLHRGNKKSPPKNDGSSPDEPEQSLLRSHAGCFS